MGTEAGKRAQQKPRRTGRQQRQSGWGTKSGSGKNHRQQRLCFRWQPRRQRRGAYTAAMLLRSQGKNDVAITSALRQEGYTPAQIAKIIQEMNK